MPEMPEWERELLSIPPSCVCDWFVDGERVMVCRVHPKSHEER